MLKAGVKFRCGYEFIIDHKAVTLCFICYTKHLGGRKRLIEY